jgi:hypothetical protein
VATPKLGGLVLRTRPGGAHTRVDGDSVGTTPVRHEVEAGSHEVAFERPGYHPAQVEVVATAGVDERVEVELQPRRRPLRIVGGVLLGVGLAAVGGGAASLALDGRYDRSHCSGDDVDFAGRCRYRYETTTLGATMTAGGAALVVTGIVLLIVQARRDRHPPQRAALPVRSSI